MGFLSEIEGPRVYLNTNILIYWIEGFSTGRSRTAGAFRRFRRGQVDGRNERTNSRRGTGSSHRGRETPGADRL